MGYRKSKKRNRALAKKKKAEDLFDKAKRGSSLLTEMENQYDQMVSIVGEYNPEIQSWDEFLSDYLDRTFNRSRELCSQFDPARIILAMKIELFAATLMPQPSNLEKSMSLVDVAAVVLYSASPLKDPDTYPSVSIGVGGLGQISSELFHQMREIRTLSMLSRFPSMHEKDTGEWIRERHLASVQWLRETSYSSRRILTYDRLFGAPEIDDLILKERCYSYSDLKSVMEWVGGLMEVRMNEAWDVLASLFQDANPNEDIDRAKANNSLTKVLAPTFDDSTFAAEEAASKLALPVEKLERFWTIFRLI